jgi:hypothetical protein
MITYVRLFVNGLHMPDALALQQTAGFGRAIGPTFAFLIIIRTRHGPQARPYKMHACHMFDLHPLSSQPSRVARGHKSERHQERQNDTDAYSFSQIW